MPVSRYVAPAIMPLLLAGCGLADGEQNSPAAIESMIEQGDYTKARSSISQIYESGEVVPEIRILTARIDLARNDGIAAETNLLSARQSGISEKRILPLLAEALARQGKSEDAAAAATKSGNKATIHFVTGLNALHARQTWQARGALEKGHLLAPNNHRLSIILSYTRAELGLFDPALKLAGKAATAEPRNINAHLAVADIALRKRKFDSALTAYGQALKISSGNRTALIGKARTLIANDKMGAAKKHLNALPPDFLASKEIQMMLGKIAARQKNYDAALTYFANAGENVKGDSEALFLSGITQRNMGQPWKAIGLMEAAVRARPDLPEYHAKLIETLQLVGDEAGARARIAEIPKNISGDTFFDKIKAPVLTK